MSTSTTSERIFNFSAGPAVLPVPVLEQIQAEMLCLPGAGASVLEISHRSKQFSAILESAISSVTELMQIPSNYRVLFLQGGSRLQFSMIPMNLLRGSGKVADYVLTGSWGKKARDEALREGTVNVAWDGKECNYNRIPQAAELKLSDDGAYVHVTSNETIQGVQFPADASFGDAPLVCDMSSDIMCRPVDVSQFGLIYACAQKNAGPAGVTVVVIREDLLERGGDDLPGYLSYQQHAEQNSLFNTPPTFGIYVFDLITKWIRNEMGGLEKLAEQNRQKSQLLYDVIDNSNGFYSGHAEPADRSLMNVTFRLPSEEQEAEFVAEAGKHGLGSLKGHRSVGGIRASIYNAMPVAGVEALQQFMTDFAQRG